MENPFRKFHTLQALEGLDFKVPLDLYLNRYFRLHKAIGSKDRKVIGDLIYGIMRWKGLIDIYTPDEKTWGRRLATFLQLDPEAHRYDPTLPMHDRLSFPESLFSLLAEQYGAKQGGELCLISNTSAKTTIRVNTLKTTRDFLFKKWDHLYDIALTASSPYGITFNKKIPLFQLDEFKRGFFEIQDEGSQLIGELVAPNPGDLVMDYCGGSGGKTLAFAHKLDNKGQIFVHDIRSGALLEARKRLKRAGIQNVQLLFPDSPNLKKLKKKMDWILVDAPCTGTGTYRRNPDMKWRFTLPFLAQFIADQRVIFERALSFLKPGGKIVYATCSILEGENGAQVDHFLKTYPLKLITPPLSLLPQIDGMDGFFGALFEKTH